MMKRSLEESSRSYNMSWLRRWVDDGRSNSRDEEGGSKSQIDDGSINIADINDDCSVRHDG